MICGSALLHFHYNKVYAESSQFYVTSLVASSVYPECGDIACPETSVRLYRGTWHHTVDDRSLCSHCSDNLKYEKVRYLFY